MCDFQLTHFHYQAVELVHELESWVTNVTGDSRETTYLFQQLSVALWKGNIDNWLACCNKLFKNNNNFWV